MTDPVLQSYPGLLPTTFEALDGWSNDNHGVAMEAFLSSARWMVNQPYKTKTLGICGEQLRELALDALGQFEGADGMDVQAARSFFEKNFQPHLIETENKPDGPDGFLTGFFEPVVKASRVRSSRFSIPLYRRPEDLVDIDDTNRPADMDPYFRFARQTKHGLTEYFDRGAINNGALTDKGLELAYVEDTVDAFFIHVQGAAKLELEQGGSMRITFAAKSGHPYTSLAKLICERENIRPSSMTADVLAHWMRSHPDELDDLLACNRSYIFFREVKDLNPDSGPIAAAKVPLVAGRSLAVDKKYHTFGTPIWANTHETLPGSGIPLRRLMIAHDTGSAIAGVSRADIFMGSGDEAGMIAGRIRHTLEMAVLVPKDRFSL